MHDHTHRLLGTEAAEPPPAGALPIDDRPGDDPPPRPPIEPDDIVLTGAINDRWKQLGGKKWAVPLGLPENLPEGGKFVRFGVWGRPYTKAIVHSPRTGAVVVIANILNAWLRYRGHGSLGFPTSDTMTTHDGQGRFQNFERSQIIWHPQTGAHEVHGAILARYGQLGGSQFGYPTTDETITPDKKGRYNHFLDVATGGVKSIYWTQETGAHEVFGLIRNAWADKNWENGRLGYPTSGEMETHDGSGRWQTFTGGIMVWHAKTGAHSVYGDILTRYTALGGSRWAYPITDEGAAANGGRFQHFKRTSATLARSIYWTQSTGAVEVVGKMRQHYEAWGWERSHLGFPVSPEQDWNDEGPGGTQQRFQGGRILYRRPKNNDDVTLAVDPMLFKQTINATGVRGEVIVTIPYNGNAHHGGFVKADKQDSYQYLVSSLVKTPSNIGVAFSETGKIFGDLHPGDERDNFNQTSQFAVPTSAFWEFQNGKLHVNKNYRSLTAAVFGDALEFALKWIIGSVVIPGPDVALVLVGGTAAVTAATGGSFASGMRLASGTLWLAGPWGTAFALAAEGAAQIASRERDLRPEEYEFAKLVFGASLPPRTNIKVCDAIGGEDRAFTWPRFDQKMVLSMGSEWNNDLRTWRTNHPNPDKRKAYGQTFIHEMVHVWQYHNNAAAISYVGDAISGSISQDYQPGIEHKEDWDWFGLEEQGAIVEQWFLTYYRGPGYVDPITHLPGAATADTAYGLASSGALNDQAFRYIRDHIRTGRN